MTRNEANRLVSEKTYMAGRYKAVRLDDALQLLGDERYAGMMQDRIRNKGPEVGSVYPWNVVDYLST